MMSTRGPFNTFFVFYFLIWFDFLMITQSSLCGCRTKPRPILSVILFTKIFFSMRMANFKIYLSIIYSTISIFNFDCYFNVSVYQLNTVLRHSKLLRFIHSFICVDTLRLHISDATTTYVSIS